MNAAAILIVLLGIFLFILGSRNTYKQVFGSLFMTPAEVTSGVSESGGGQPSESGTPKPGDTYNYSQLVTLAKQAGFNQAQALIAGAIALAESGGNPNATGRYGERGLWQVYPAAHPDLAQHYNLYDPLQNAQAALSVYGMQGWNAWTTYQNGAYKGYLP